MSNLQAAAMLAGAIAEEGARLVARPLVVDFERRREEIARLRAQLDDFGDGPGRRYVNNFAPLLLHALDRALYFRRFNDAAMAEKFDSLVGTLVAHVRGDARAALDARTE